MASFDVKRVTPLEWAGIGAGALAFIFTFLPWVSIDAGFLGGSVSAWNSGFLAWFSMLLLVAAGVLVALPHFETQVRNLPLIWMILAGVSLLFVLLRWVTISGSTFGLASASVGLFLGLLAAVVSGVAAFLTFRTSSARTQA